MKLLLTLIGWKEYPEDGVVEPPFVHELTDSKKLVSLIILFGNGVIGEMRAEADCEEAIEVLRGVARGPGSCQQVTLSAEEKEKLWLYRERYECYTQAGDPPGYIFINPNPQPALFAPSPDAAPGGAGR